MTVALIIGVLVAIAIPAYRRAESRANAQTCYANQRTIEGAAQTWLSSSPGNRLQDLVGTVDADHPLIVGGVVMALPTCPSAPSAADELHPTPAEGAYVFDALGTVTQCPFGRSGPHGHY